jgi:NAD(P)-dependent dehydrogenase (short-subunit alcohol dehydrogenase family)
MAYAASKAGIERFTNGLAEEVREYGISVNCLKPAGFIESEGLKYWSTPETDKSEWEPPDLMVKAALFLSIQTASGVTGRVFTEKQLQKEFDLD